METLQNSGQAPDPEMARLERLTKILDDQFRIPGTKIRFGLDGFIGLIPYLGDISGFAVSGILMHTMAKKGAGPWLMLRMMWNHVLDALVGLVPFLGDLLDFGYKANRRNLNLLKAYYADGKIKPNAKGSAAFLLFLFLLVFAGLLWAIWKFSAMLIAWVWGLWG